MFRQICCTPLRRTLALVVSLVVSGGAPSAAASARMCASVGGARHARSEPATSSTSGRTGSGRPRLVQDQDDRGDSGPLIRVALLTDVRSIEIASSQMLLARGGSEGKRETLRIAGGKASVELRRQTGNARVEGADGAQANGHASSSSSSSSIPSEARRELFRVWVGSSSLAERANRLSDQLKSEFYEPTSIVYDTKSKDFNVFIGIFGSKAQAQEMVDRLRHAGYAAPRIASKPSSEERQTALPHGQRSPGGAAPDQSVKSVAAKAAPAGARSARGARSAAHATSQGRLCLTASDGAKTVAADDEKIIFSARDADEQGLVNYREVYTSSIDNDHVNPAGRESKQAGASARSLAEQDANVTTAALRIGKRDYRGEIQVLLNRRGLMNVINVLPLEEYLRGVVPMEAAIGSPPQIEALKAQVVAMRSFALAARRRYNDEGFDLWSDTRSQLYGGVSVEKPITDRAIDETRGTVALYTDPDGHSVPIEALYTPACGGRTEDNERVFGGKPLPYLRSVACAPERLTFAGHDVITTRAPESSAGLEGASLMRDFALLRVLGFALPRQLNSQVLAASPNSDEVTAWFEHAARLARRDQPLPLRGDAARLPEFTHLLADAVYGEDARSLLSPAEIDYMLTGMGADDWPQPARAGVAMLLKDGILSLPRDGGLANKHPISYELAIQTLARALTLKSRLTRSRPSLESGSANLHSNQEAESEINGLGASIAAPAENGRLILQPSPLRSGSKNQPHKAGLHSSNEKLAPKPAASRRKGNVADYDSASTAIGQRPALPRTEYDIAPDAWFFRNLGSERYGVDHLKLIGGERVAYHVNPGGKVDFLEASTPESSVRSARLAGMAEWQTRLTPPEVRNRLARARVNLGEIENLIPRAYSPSNRVCELEIVGQGGRARLKGHQIRSALGLKETLFVLERERDERGRITSFLFTGRGSGHGVGLCQTGAYGLAKEGHSYVAILQKYYTDITVQRIY